MGTVAPSSEQVLADELAQVRAFVVRGESRAALKLLERVRRESLARGRVDELEAVLALATVVCERLEGECQGEAGRLVFSARQNIRLLGRRQALAEGREWVDPFAAAPASLLPAPRELSSPRGGMLAAAQTGSDAITVEHAGEDWMGAAAATSGRVPAGRPRRDLWRLLIVQALLLPVYWLLGFVGEGTSPSSPGWATLALMTGFWFVISVLLVRWWREGRSGLVRRAVAWAVLSWLSLFLLLLLPFRRTRKLLVPPPAPQAVRLSELRDLHDSGLLTDEEFEAKKAKVLTG